MRIRLHLPNSLTKITGHVLYNTSSYLDIHTVNHKYVDTIVGKGTTWYDLLTDNRIRPLHIRCTEMKATIKALMKMTKR